MPYLTLFISLLLVAFAAGCAGEPQISPSDPFAALQERDDQSPTTRAAELAALERDASVIKDAPQVVSAIEEFGRQCQSPQREIYTSVADNIPQIRCKDVGRLLVQGTRVWLVLDGKQKFFVDRASLSSIDDQLVVNAISQAHRAAQLHGADRQANLLGTIYGIATDDEADTKTSWPNDPPGIVTDKTQVLAALLGFCDRCASSGAWVAGGKGYNEYASLPNVGRATLDSSELTVSYVDGRTYATRVEDLSAEERAIVQSAFASLTGAAKASKQSKGKL